MPSNDKLSLMSAAAGGDLAGSTTRIEITSLYTTVPVTLACTLQQLRTTMFAGGSGYTATDPITAGAASFTTGAFSGAVSLNSAGPWLIAGASATTSSAGFYFNNTSGQVFAAAESSVGGTWTGSAAYSAVFGTGNAKSLHLVTNATVRATWDSAGALTQLGNLTVGASTFVVTAATGAVSAAGLITSTLTTGKLFTADSATTASVYQRFSNTAGSVVVGLESSTGGSIITGTNAYAVVIGTDLAKSVQICTNNAPNLTILSGGAATFSSSLAITGALTGVTTVNLTTQPAFVAGDKYLVISAAGDIHVSALGPAS